MAVRHAHEACRARKVIDRVAGLGLVLQGEWCAAGGLEHVWDMADLSKPKAVLNVAKDLLNSVCKRSDRAPAQKGIPARSIFLSGEV